VTLSGTKRYSDKSGEYYLKNVLTNQKQKKIQKKNQNNIHKSCDFDINKNLKKGSKVISNKQLDNYLTPIPMNPKKSIIKNKYDKAALNNAQKTAIFLRRIEYSTNMRKNNKNKKINEEIIRKIIIIQKWWKTLYLIILLQKNIRGFLSRTKLIESLEKQENFINMLLHIHWLHKKIVFKRFIKKLYYNDTIILLIKMINNFFFANLRLLIRKWKIVSLKSKTNENLKIWFDDWKKTIEKFSILKNMLHNYSKNKKTKSNKDNNINKSFKKMNPKNHKEDKNEKEEEKKIKKTTVAFNCNKKKNQINDMRNDNFEESEFLNDNNNNQNNSEIVLFKNKRNSIKNLKKFEDLNKNEMNKTKILSSRGNDFSNKHDMNKTFTNEKINKYSKTEAKIINTKKRINEKFEDNDKEKDKNKIDIEKEKKNKNKKNKLMKRNITTNNNSKILNTNTNKILHSYDTNISKVLNTHNSSKILNNNKVSNTQKKENKSKEIINNKNIIDNKSNVKNKKKKEEKENDNNNVNFINDPPFQDILKENTQAAIKEKEQIVNNDNYDIKEDNIYDKEFDNDNLLNFNSIDDENIKDISFKNEDNLFSNTNEINNENQKKIKEMVINFEKKPKNSYNVSKTEENNTKNIDIENLNNNNKILDNDKNIQNKIEENNKIIENNSKEEYNDLEKQKDKKISDRMGSPTLIKKNNILQAKIQFQKPTQNILELKQKNNELNQIQNNENKNNNNNNTLIDDDIENMNINQELENLSKFKPPSKIKEIVIENLNLNKHNDQRNDDFYTGYNNHFTNEDERRLNHSLSNYELGQDFYMNNLNLTQNYIYNPINERFITFSYNPNNQVLGCPMPVDQINNFEFRRNNSNNIPNYEQKNEFENNKINVNTFHKKTFSSNNLYQYKHPHLSGMTFTKKIIPNSDVSFSYLNHNNLRDSQNFNTNNQLNLTLNNAISNSPIQNNFGNKIYMRRVNICPPKNLNKTYIQQQGFNNSKIN